MKRADKQAGGFARAAALTAERRTEIAREAGRKRWLLRDEKKAGEAPALIDAAHVTENTHGSDARPSIEIYRP